MEIVALLVVAVATILLGCLLGEIVYRVFLA